MSNQKPQGIDDARIDKLAPALFALFTLHPVLV